MGSYGQPTLWRQGHGTRVSADVMVKSPKNSHPAGASEAAIHPVIEDLQQPCTAQPLNALPVKAPIA